jgi:hypothetical protein
LDTDVPLPSLLSLNYTNVAKVSNIPYDKKKSVFLRHLESFHDNNFKTQLDAVIIIYSFIWPVGAHCVPTGHHDLSQRVTVTYAACTQCPPEDEHLRLETCTGT